MAIDGRKSASRTRVAQPGPSKKYLNYSNSQSYLGARQIETKKPDNFQSRSNKISESMLINERLNKTINIKDLENQIAQKHALPSRNINYIYTNEINSLNGLVPETGGDVMAMPDKM